jgi:hypothetical protein
VLGGVEEKENVMSGGFENIKPNKSTTKKVPKNMLSFVVCWDHIKNPNMYTNLLTTITKSYVFI